VKIRAPAKINLSLRVAGALMVISSGYDHGAGFALRRSLQIRKLRRTTKPKTRAA
jgi:hypothetical protein